MHTARHAPCYFVEGGSLAFYPYYVRLFACWPSYDCLIIYEATLKDKFKYDKWRSVASFTNMV